MNEPPAAFLAGLETLGIALPGDAIERLGRYLDLLLEANRSFNLTRVTDPCEAWERHVLDSLTLVPLLGEAGSLVDVGSGGGLPGIPLAIACGRMRVHLVEATGKKARFLRETAGALALANVTVHHGRAETLAHDPAHRGQYDLVTGRALGPLPVFLELTAAFSTVGGRILAPKGRKVDEELARADKALRVLRLGKPLVHHPLGGEACIVEVTKPSRTPAIYPRAPGTPKKDPL